MCFLTIILGPPYQNPHVQILLNISDLKTSVMEGNQGMTIHKLLEKVDLLNFIFDEDGDGSSKGKEKPSDVTKTVVRNSDPTSTYLGL